jgi:hypothetical protein
MTALDIDGRIYQILRRRGGDPTVTVTPDPPEQLRTTVIPDCLSTLLTTFQRLAAI